jgi:hypothetical protein
MISIGWKFKLNMFFLKEELEEFDAKISLKIDILGLK